LKKILGAVLCLAVLLSTVPMTASAATTEAGIIDMHGTKTYIGSASAWSKTWNPSNFTDVTNKDASWSGNLTIKSGTVQDVSVSGDNTKVTVTSGTIGSIDADGDVTLNGGTVKNDVEAGKSITLNGAVTVKGSCIADNITATGSTTATVGKLVGSDTIILGNVGVKANKISGNGSATLQLKSYKLNLPTIEEMETIEVTDDATVTGTIDTRTLSIPSKKQLTAKSTVEVGTLEGPGTLAFVSGKLRIDDGVSGSPMITFLNSVHNGSLAFKASSGRVDPDDIVLYDYSLESDTDGGEELFYLTDSIKDGVTLSESSVSVSSKGSVSVKAYVRPSLSKYATGTKLKWELHGDTSSFSISPDTSNNTCKVSYSGTKNETRTATLTCYLVDSRGDRLPDYKSGSCTITGSQGTSSNNGNTTTTGLTLDTSAVTIPIGNTYWVLAITNSATAPAQMSYNSAVATVGAPKAYNAGGKKGWLYPVTGVAKGAVTIDIGGQKMIATVSGGSAIVDTSSYTMAPGGQYCIGVRLYGINKKSLNVHSANSCTTVQYGGSVNGLELYRVHAEKSGIGGVIFELPNGKSVRTQINIIAGETPHGVSARLIVAE